jgi:acyl carrier protein
MQRDHVISALADAAKVVLGADPATISESTAFAEDLDADSLDLVELVMQVEDALDIEIGDTELGDVRTVGDAADLVLRVTAASA